MLITININMNQRMKIQHPLAKYLVGPDFYQPLESDNCLLVVY